MDMARASASRWTSAIRRLMRHRAPKQVAYLTTATYHSRMFDHCLYFNTSALARKLDRVWAEAFAPFDLTPPQGFMLRAIVDRPGMLQSALSAAMSVSRPTATRALDGLEAKRLIERRRTEADGRETAIFPTPEAVGIGAALNEASGAVTARLKRLLGGTEFAETVAKIRRVRSTLA